MTVSLSGCRSRKACHGAFASVTRISLPSEKTALGLKKQPSQPRAVATIAVILEGAAQIIERGNAVTTNTIAERAGVSIGTLYQYFDDKEGVIAELSRQSRRDLVSAVGNATHATSAAPLTDDLQRVLHAALSADARRPALALALDRLEHALSLDEDDRCITTALDAHLARWLQGHYPEASSSELNSLASDLHAIAQVLTRAAQRREERIDAPFFVRTAITLDAMIAARLRDHRPGVPLREA